MYPNAKCYILAADYNFGQISTQWAEKAIEANGGTVVGEEYIPMDVSQFASIIANVSAARTIVLYITTSSSADFSVMPQII